MDKAVAASEDNVLRKTLEEARSGLSAYLALQGVVPGGGLNGAVRGPRSSTDLGEMGTTLLDYVKANPGQRGEQIAEALGTDSKGIHGPMKRLIDDRAVRTKGERRGMRYYQA